MISTNSIYQLLAFSLYNMSRRYRSRSPHRRRTRRSSYRRSSSEEPPRRRRMRRGSSPRRRGGTPRPRSRRDFSPDSDTRRYKLHGSRDRVRKSSINSDGLYSYNIRRGSASRYDRGGSRRSRGGGESDQRLKEYISLIYQELKILYKTIKEETRVIIDHPIARRNKFHKLDTGEHPMTKKLDDRVPANEMLQHFFEQTLCVRDHLNRDLREHFFSKLKETHRSNGSGRYEDRRRDDRYSRDHRVDRLDRGSRYDRGNSRYDRDYAYDSKSSRRNGERYRRFRE